VEKQVRLVKLEKRTLSELDGTCVCVNCGSVPEV